MRIGLIDVDSKIPNLALMKLSAYYKKNGCSVELVRQKFSYLYDKVFVSKVFDFSEMPYLGFYRDVEIGGIGYDIKKRLRDEIEYLMPDYFLYPDVQYSLGFTTRGCIRRCAFCVVPKKEGKIKVVTDIYDIWNGSHKKIVLLDNNILALPQHFFMIASQIKKENLQVDFNQGLDCRLLTDSMVKELKELRCPIRFAFDDVNYESSVLRAIGLLKKYGISQAHLWYVLVGFNSTIDDDLYRLNLLRVHNQRAYVQRYNFCRDKVYIPISRWANQTYIFRKMTFKQFIEDPRNPDYYREMFG